ncbi:type I 3-dehydroquinate dehydratase [Bacillus safensis]|uniref:type I 3-dehydroquinate dehydratase n=1 Tax=Bacillus TaxID=1386 RepID=UPI000DCB4882|nr:type I 3-dehydroquinate dehydratase [Bacillus safensis]MDP4566853.1 type I 3-dehydroquinate dehydratase [Bacillus safensis]MEC0923252.1 type I 3-dehydroquinate dehydratase [Bacillus safensis]MEC0984173.1 type I 3-dehydroquinate dehydratase [Bacillus safensis]MEC0996704.1 type I 3-dehydroquinate dehydratase [Bacillus safensis]MEC1000561.1 type I 3-dehydroquinate dehydratase [Bacillus safensis]
MDVNAFQQKVKSVQAGGQPMICTPLIGQTKEELFHEVEVLTEKNPDVIEWRADFFHHLHDKEQVIETLKGMVEKAKGIPFLFTIRSEKEGGESISLSESEKVSLLAELCSTQLVDAVDYELMHDVTHIQQVSQAAKRNGITLIVSYHDFQRTPEVDRLVQLFVNAESVGADIAKIAVMPHSYDDALTLLSATSHAKKQLSIPVISMAMGEYGAFTRMIGGLFGSVMTFAVGKESSAPGQVAIQDLNNVLSIVFSKNK